MALSRAGTSLATREILAFQAAYAEARDAVHLNMDSQALQLECEARGWPSLIVQSSAPDRATYLRRPDLGRKLNAASRDTLFAYGGKRDLAIVLADGLSALALHRHALELCASLFALLDGAGWSYAPLVLTAQARVAIGDDIGEIFEAEMALVLIGERPGLSAADSLGAYLTWNPHCGKTDAERNCISNIRPAALDYATAARRIFLLLNAARKRQLTGVLLKEGGGPYFSAPLPPTVGDGKVPQAT